MNADEIRKKPLELVNKIAHASREDHVTSIISCACFEMLVEIAAQMSEFNAHMDRLEWLAENVINLNGGGLQVKVNQ